MDNYLGCHIPEDVLEQFAMGKLAEEACHIAEEHLFVCDACQAALQELDDFISVVREALVTVDGLLAVR